MIRFDQVTITYDGAPYPAVVNATFDIAEGELCVVVGATGAGKSTLLGAMNGLVPRFTGGTLRGTVTVAGFNTSQHPVHALAEVVGYVGQDPVAGFVTDTVEEELAYGMEQLAVAPDVMRKRVEETLDLLGIAELRSRSLADLSGGQQQRVAIGAALTSHPRILVLDEPTSALDPTAAEDVLATLTRLVHDLGMTVVVAEHRLERVVAYADRVVLVQPDRSVIAGRPAEVLATALLAPPVVELARLAGWRPTPLSVRDARRHAGELRTRLSGRCPSPPDERLVGETAITADRVEVTYGKVRAVRSVTARLHRSEIVALMGRNGAGKTSLLWALQGSGSRAGGTVDVGGVDPAALGPATARRHVGLVPQTPGDLLYLESVDEECTQADRETRSEQGTCRRIFGDLTPGVDPSTHPRDLSEGQRLALALAIQLTAAPRVVLLDEPTRGLDYGAKSALVAILNRLASVGHLIVIATNDVEFAASVADRVLVMADGEIVADGPAPAVLLGSPSFAPQVSKIMAPEPWLTVAQVRAALAQATV